MKERKSKSGMEWCFMFHPPTILDEDVQTLIKAGYSAEIHGAYLVISSIPYVNSKGEFKYGMFACEINSQGDSPPKRSHNVVFWRTANNFWRKFPYQHNGGKTFYSRSGRF